MDGGYRQVWAHHLELIARYSPAGQVCGCMSWLQYANHTTLKCLDPDRPKSMILLHVCMGISDEGEVLVWPYFSLAGFGVFILFSRFASYLRLCPYMFTLAEIGLYVRTIYSVCGGCFKIVDKSHRTP